MAIEGSEIPKPVIAEIAGLRIASPIDKARIEQACQNLQDSGLFASISYQRSRPEERICSDSCPDRSISAV